MLFKVRNYIGPKRMLAVGRKQDMVLEVTGFSNGLDMQEDVRIKTLNMGNLCYTIAQGRKSAKSRPEGESDELIFSYIVLGWGHRVRIWE